ncbi:hypothetical protein AAG906_019729 [Vitis piasezkii]
MAASAKTITLDSSNIISDWTVVLPRRGKQRRNFLKTDLEMDHHIETKLTQKIQICTEKLENSYILSCSLESSPDSSHVGGLFRVLGSELKMQMVLSLAILLKRKFSWIGDIEVFDPILSATESRVLEALGCSVLSVNEQGRRQASKPILFFMPHCEAELYLVQANWRTDFGTYEQHVSEFRSSTLVDSSRHILAVRKFMREFAMKTVSDDYFGAFHDSSWHFLNLVA